MNGPRFQPGDKFHYDGIDFRVAQGTKRPRSTCPNGDAHHPHGDLRIDWYTQSGWRPVTCHPLFLLAEFIAWNEDYLYPPPRNEGGAMIMKYLRRARELGHKVASKELNAVIAQRRAREQAQPRSTAEPMF